MKRYADQDSIIAIILSILLAFVVQTNCAFDFLHFKSCPKQRAEELIKQRPKLFSFDDFEQLLQRCSPEQLEQLRLTALKISASIEREGTESFYGMSPKKFLLSFMQFKLSLFVYIVGVLLADGARPKGHISVLDGSTQANVNLLNSTAARAVGVLCLACIVGSGWLFYRCVINFLNGFWFREHLEKRSDYVAARLEVIERLRL